MTTSELKTHIRLALHSLGRNPSQKLPREKAALDVTLRLLRIEQHRRGGILKENRQCGE